jgi:hypothetical protein
LSVCAELGCMFIHNSMSATHGGITVAAAIF